MKLLLVSVIMIAVQSCGKKLDVISLDQIHVWGPEDMTCKTQDYPIWQRICDTKHVSCTTWQNGKTDCIITFTANELEEKL